MEALAQVLNLKPSESVKVFVLLLVVVGDDGETDREPSEGHAGGGATTAKGKKEKVGAGAMALRHRVGRVLPRALVVTEQRMFLVDGRWGHWPAQFPPHDRGLKDTGRDSESGAAGIYSTTTLATTSSAPLITVTSSRPLTDLVSLSFFDNDDDVFAFAFEGEEAKDRREWECVAGSEKTKERVAGVVTDLWKAIFKVDLAVKTVRGSRAPSLASGVPLAPSRPSEMREAWDREAHERRSVDGSLLPGSSAGGPSSAEPRPRAGNVPPAFVLDRYQAEEKKKKKSTLLIIFYFIFCCQDAGGVFPIVPFPRRRL